MKNYMQVFILSPYEEKQSFVKEKRSSELFFKFNICLKQAHHPNTINLKWSMLLKIHIDLKKYTFLHISSLI